MERLSYTSLSNYFAKLRQKGQEIDEGINRLSETWKTPALLIGGYEERNAEIEENLQEIWDSIRTTNDSLEMCQMELKSSLKAVDKVLGESSALYNSLKEQCDSLETVLVEYGYNYEENNDSQQGQPRDDSKDDAILIAGRISDMEIEFTPNLSWKRKSTPVKE